MHTVYGILEVYSQIETKFGKYICFAVIYHLDDNCLNLIVNNGRQARIILRGDRFKFKKKPADVVELKITFEKAVKKVD